MNLRWAAKAVADRDSIFTYVEKDSLSAAIQLDERIWNTLLSLLDFSMMGRVGRCKGTREIVVSGTPYIVAYQISPEAIRVMRILHGARRWPKRMPQL